MSAAAGATRAVARTVVATLRRSTMKRYAMRRPVVALLAAAGAAAVFGLAAPASAAPNVNAVVGPNAAAVVGASRSVEARADHRESGVCRSTTVGRQGRTTCTVRPDVKISLYTKCSTGRTVKAVRHARGSTANVRVSCPGRGAVRAVRAWTTIKVKH
jgi:hypothetical protein